MAKTYSIAIDGPAGAGKSTIARRLAKELGYYYVDTGAIYRTVAYFLDLLGVSPKDVDGVERYIDELTIEIEYDDDGVQHMIMNGMDVSGDIRTQDISQKASLVSAHVWCGICCWICSGMWPRSTMSLWTVGTSARWCCPVPM